MNKLSEEIRVLFDEIMKSVTPSATFFGVTPEVDQIRSKTTNSFLFIVKVIVPANFQNTACCVISKHSNVFYVRKEACTHVATVKFCFERGRR